MNTNSFRFFFIILSLLSTFNYFGQIKIVEGTNTPYLNKSPIYFDISNKREIIPLVDNWKIFQEEEPERAITATIPAAYIGLENIVFQKSFKLSDNQILNYNVELHILRLNYSADILLNEVVISKHTGGNYSFSINLPKDLLKSGAKNILKIRIKHQLDAANTIPVAQRFLFPQNQGGILDQVYLHLTPAGGIKNVTFTQNLNIQKKSAQLDIAFEIGNKLGRDNDSLNVRKTVNYVNIYLLDNNLSTVKSISNYPVKFTNKTSSVQIKQKLEFSKIKLWQPNSPNFYSIKIDYFVDNILVDETFRNVQFVKIEHSKSGITINEIPFTIKGTTYYFNYGSSGSLINIKQLAEDLSIIKKAGFNTVRFAKELPSPYSIYLCNRLGLFAQIELPVSGVPDQVLSSNSFSDRSKALASEMLNLYGNFTNIIGFGIGSSFLSSNPVNLAYIQKIAAFVKSKSNKITYASFLSFPSKPIDNIDLYGIELLDAEPKMMDSDFSSASNTLGKSNIFISGATYPTYKGNTNGYLNKFSFEGQAKYFENLVDYANKKNLGGFVINSMFDFRGDFNSLYSGYTKNNLYRIGILSESRKTDRISFKLLQSKLLSGEKVTIPIGTKKDNSPILFIILSVLLSILMAILINSKRKFREDATRALMRSYNFFADIRDLRIISGLHTTLLMFTLSGVLSLLVTIILAYLKNNLLLEKILLAFNLHWLISVVSYLAWHPLQSFFYLLIFFAAYIVLHVGIVKLFSLFIKTRVLTISIFFTIVWALLPLVLLLPLELFLHRLLLAEIGNIFIYSFLLLYLLWLVQRIFKGIYVIFDIRLSTVYFYGISLFILFIGVFIIYFQLTDSTIYYLFSSFKQYQYL